MTTMEAMVPHIVGGLLVLNATFASSAPSGIVEDMMEQFRFSIHVATLTVSLFVAGYCVGPLLWGPLSESYGRRPIFIIILFYTGFQVDSALSPNTASILTFRLLGGIFASCPLANSGALVSDIWDARTRGKALALFSVAPFAGPALGPVVAGYISTAGASWRWLYWVLTIFAGFCLFIIYFTLPETFAPVLLVIKAKRLRAETGDERYYAPLESEDKIPLGKRVEKILARPFKVMFQEPMLIAVTMYMSFVFGCIYLLFEAFPIVFVEGHHFRSGTLGLMFLPLFLGSVVGVISYLIVFNPPYERATDKYAPDPVPPEVRLELALFAAPLFAISFFWVGWTSFPSISFCAPMMSSLVLGWTAVHIFLALINYIIDTYLFVAASALAAATVVRSVFGAVFPLFTRQMYVPLNPRWASTLLGCIALFMVPIPFVLMKYGPTLRAKSKNAPTKAPMKIENIDIEGEKVV
ncbi:MFS general substrate transporter [Rickenella mellea]|uniref:MFS general substrate transporter n=1 Tax=Rickenella mellea TaxID=50990 RepID=A0A4Y7Q2G8_9AGAM|nr:MFS general substrate transporter [Rickenella mellea]